METDKAARTPRRFRDLAGLQRAFFIALGFLVVLVGFITLAQKISGPETTFGDEARFGLESRRAVSAIARSEDSSMNLSLKVRGTGAYTTSDQYGGEVTFEPGPAAHLVALPFVRGLGTRNGLWTFAVALNLTALLLAAWAAFRTGGLGVAAWVVACGLLTLNLTTQTFVLNINFLVLPSFAALLVAWAVSTGDVALYPLLAGLVSFIVQTHLGYGVVPVVAALAATALLATHSAKFRKLLGWRYSGPTFAVLLVLWFPPLLDQIFGTRNLSKLLGLRLPGSGLVGAWNGLGAILHLPPALQPEALNLQSPRAVELLVAAALAVGLIKYWPRFRPQYELLVITLAVLLGSLLVAWLSPPGSEVAYHLYWIGIAVGFLLTAAGILLLTIENPAGRMIRRWNPNLRLSLGLCIVAVAALPLLAPRQLSAGDQRIVAATESLTDSLAKQLDPTVPWVLVSRGGWSAEAVANGVIAHLGDAGVSVRKGVAVEPGEHALILSSGPLDVKGKARGIAKFGEQTSTSKAWSTAVDAFAADHAPVRMATNDSNLVSSYLDGRTDSICPDQTVLGASALRGLAPGALAGLYAHGQVLEPRLPPELLGGVQAWMEDQQFFAYELPAAREQEELTFSSVDCSSS
ncbi:hypothetical protein IMCC26207_10488 [Actinobacteria bacterium IMCC26207]|nr:hypothetical protein IMCC26207_10488 [Actinobacteria bacterium IMCC26207]